MDAVELRLQVFNSRLSTLFVNCHQERHYNGSQSYREACLFTRPARQGNAVNTSESDFYSTDGLFNWMRTCAWPRPKKDR